MLLFVKLAIALAIAIPFALGVVHALMRIADAANHRADRWERFCLGKL